MNIKTKVLPVEYLLQIILKQYFESAYCVAFICDETFQFQYSSGFVYLNPGESHFDQLLLQVSEMGCLDYVVKMQRPDMFMTVFDKIIHRGNMRRGDRKIIFVPNFYANNVTENMLRILTMKESSFVANILIIAPSVNNRTCGETYDMITHKYVGLSNHSQPLYLDHWRSCTRKFRYNANLFPHSISNMHGKIIKVSCFTYKPYVLLDIDPAEVKSGRDGMDVRIVEEFCRWLNCSIKIIREDEHQWGEIYSYENLTGVGVLGSLVGDHADIGITALYSWYEEFLALDFTAPCIRTGITCIAPAPRMLARWETPFLPFSLYMWIAIMITFLYASLALIIAQGCSIKNVLLTTFGMMITQAQSNASNGWRMRMVTGWLLITGLVLDNAYSGGLASTFTVPRFEKSIDTIKDIIDRKMEWGATHDAWTFSLALSQEPRIKKLVKQFRKYSFEELQRKSFTRSMAFSIEKLPAGYYAIGEYISEKAVLDFTIMSEDFYYEQCVVMLRKSSVYTDKLSQLVGRLHESGLLLAWETQVALQHLNYKVQLEVKLSRTKKDVEQIEPLALKHVLGVFAIFGIGVFTSCLFFIMELIFKRKPKICIPSSS